MKLVDIICKACGHTEEALVDDEVSIGGIVIKECPVCENCEFFATILSAPKISMLFSESHREKMKTAYERFKLESEARKKEFREGDASEAKRMLHEAQKIKIS